MLNEHLLSGHYENHTDTSPPRSGSVVSPISTMGVSTFSEPIAIDGASTGPSSILPSAASDNHLGTSPRSQAASKASSLNIGSPAIDPMQTSPGTETRERSMPSPELHHQTSQQSLPQHVHRRPLPVHSNSSSISSTQQDHVFSHSPQQRQITPRPEIHSPLDTAPPNRSAPRERPSLPRHHTSQEDTAAQRNRFWSRQPTVTNIARVRAVANQDFYMNELSNTADIRLLKLLPATDGQISLRLEKCSLQDSVKKYEALSYCWGSDEESEELIINSRAGYRVSKHLACALRRLRFEDRTRVLWIDAICINQVR